MKNRITALFVCKFSGCGLCRNFLSNFTTILLIIFTLLSPMDLMRSKVSGIPNKDTTMHKSWPTGVRGVILPYPAKNTKKIKALTLKKTKGKERFLQCAAASPRKLYVPNYVNHTSHIAERFASQTKHAKL